MLSSSEAVEFGGCYIAPIKFAGQPWGFMETHTDSGQPFSCGSFTCSGFK